MDLEASAVPLDVLNVLERSEVSSIKLSQIIFDLVIFTFYREELLTKEMTRNLKIVSLNHGVKVQYKRRQRYRDSNVHAQKETVVGVYEQREWTDADCKVRFGARQRLTWISTLLDLDGGTKEEVWIPNSRDTFVITTNYCYQQ